MRQLDSWLRAHRKFANSIVPVMLSLLMLRVSQLMLRTQCDDNITIRHLSPRAAAQETRVMAVGLACTWILASVIYAGLLRVFVRQSDRR